MKEATFNLVVAKLQEGYELNRKTNELGISIIEITEGYTIAINALLMEAFSTDKVETLQWYLYEYRKGKMIISDSKTKKTLYNLEKKGHLWAYMNDLPAPRN
jgi:hypothetical protein